MLRRFGDRPNPGFEGQAVEAWSRGGRGWVGGKGRRWFGGFGGGGGSSVRRRVGWEGASREEELDDDVSKGREIDDGWGERRCVREIEVLVHALGN